MTFTVTYRGADGALREETVEAAGRAECFAKMKARGIVPVSVKEGASLGERASRPFRSRAKTSPRNAQDARCPSGGGKPQSSILNLKSSIILAATVLAVAGGVWWWLSAREDARPHVEKPKAVKDVKDIKDVKGVKDVKDVKNLKVPTNAPPPAVASAAGASELFNGVPVVSRSAVTNANGAVVERIRTADGKSHRVTTAPKRVFDNASDQLIAMAIHGANGGVGMPPLPMGDSVEEDFRRSLASPIEIRDDDSDEVKLVKMEVMAVRDVLKERIAQGMTVRQALEEHQDEVNHIATYNAEALAMLREIREKEGPEAAREFFKTVNKNLKDMGIKEIPSPAKRNSAKAKEQKQ
jgi:hypothetical protein